MIASLARLVGALLGLTLVAAIGGGVWLGYQAFYAKDLAMQRKEAELAEQRALAQRLAEDNRAKQQRIERLETAMRLLKIDHRVAYIDVLDQQRQPGGDDVRTTFRYVEVDDDGNELAPPRELTVDGDVLYVDYWVIKFDDELVEQGDPLRGASICLLRRLFGEHQQPSEGFAVDAEGTRPAVYGRGESSEFQRELWENFWEYATNPATAQAAGVRAAHGEAPYTKLVPGQRYKIELRASGGLSIEPEDDRQRQP